MTTKRSHYKAPTKAGFTAGEVADLLKRHSPEADYRMVITFRGKVRELIVDEEEVHGLLREAAVECAAPDHTPGNACPPADDQRHGGKAEAAYHGGRWPAAENLS